LLLKQSREDVKAFRAYRKRELERIISGVLDSIETHVSGDWRSSRRWPDSVSASRSIEADFPTRGVWSFSHDKFGELGQVFALFSGDIPRLSYENAAANDGYGLEREILLDRLFGAIREACLVYIKEQGGVGRVELL
jgi:hypothetical protein